MSVFLKIILFDPVGGKQLGHENDEHFERFYYLINKDCPVTHTTMFVHPSSKGTLVDLEGNWSSDFYTIREMPLSHPVNSAKF